MTAEIALLIEPFEIEGGCSTATIRKGQKFVWMHVYVAAYEEEGAWGAFEYQLSVKVNGTPVYTVNNLTFNTETECVVSSICDRIVDKVIDVSGFTLSASAQLEVIAHAVRPPGVDDPGHYGTVYTELTVRPRSRFLLSDTRQDFRPRNSDSADPVAASCNSGYDCYPSFEARLHESCCDVKIGFELSEVSTLAGVSTNYGSGTGADYAVDPELNQGMVSVSAPPGTTAYETAEPWTMANLMLSSKDYGGRAKVKAYFLAPETGQKIYAEVVEDLEQPPEPHSTMERQFARLPFDEDNDGMADGWENLYGNLSSSEDQDRLLNGDSTVGDGLTVQEEYRGFHFIDPSTTEPTVRWTSTNPREVLDLFTWDLDGLFVDDVWFFTSQYPFITVRHVDPSTGAELETPSPAPYVLAKRLNRNSTSSYPVFPLVLRNVGLGGNCNPSVGPVSATLARAPENPKGYGPDGRDIRVDNSNLDQCGQTYGFPASAWRAIIISHEIGHNLGLSHPIELRGHTVIPYSTTFSLLQGLPRDRYASDPTPSPQNPNARFYISLRDYLYSVPGTSGLRLAERVSTESGLLAAYNTQLGLCGSFYTILDHPRSSLYCHDAQPALVSAPGIVVEASLYTDEPTNTILNVMNWTPRLDSIYHSASSWAFSASDKSQSTCIRRCPQPE